MNALTDRKLLNIIKTLPFFLIVIFVSVLLMIVVSDSHKRANQLERNLIASNLERQKEIIAQRVKSSYNQIRYERRQVASLLKSQVKYHVDIAHQVASTIYQANRDKPEIEVKQMIADALRKLRYNDDRGYFFIYSMDGTNIMLATTPETEGTQRLEMRDTRGVQFLKEYIEILKQSEDGAAYHRWWFTKPQSQNEYEKIGYGRHFVPYDWIIGSGEYVEDVEKQIQQNILRWISNYRFGENGYLFVLDEQGQVLAHKDPLFVDSNFTKLVTEASRTFDEDNKNAGYVQYQSPYHPDGLLNSNKVSYIKFDPEWGWLIGSGIYVEEVERRIAPQIFKLREQVRSELFKVLLLCLSLALILTLLSILLSNYLGRRFSKFQNRIEADFSKLEKRKEQLRQLAQYDPLTQLPNRLLLEDKVKQGISESKKHQLLLAVLFVDIDKFKRVNDKYGHDAGDVLLTQIAKRFSRLVADKGSVARFGGDEFVFCLPKLNDEQQARKMVSQIQSCLLRPFLVHGISIELSSSIGVSLYPNDALEPRALMSKANIVLSRSKKQGKGNVTFFDQKISEELTNKFLLEDEFKDALQRGELDVYYQPQIDSVTGTMKGIEALCRWISPTLGVISPVVFIDMAEKNNAILDLGKFVFDKACKDAHELNLTLSQPISVSINISPTQLLHPHFTEMVVTTAKRHDMPTELIILELTENVFIEDIKAIQPTLEKLRTLGFGISLDDFGTGFSSLSYLNLMPITEIKIDRSFITRMQNSQSNLNIVKTIVAIAHSNDLNIVAEGVEQIEQQNLLHDMKCYTIQGYLYSKPVPIGDIHHHSRMTVCH
ncbi:cache domain-containing protein [Vibrio sp. 404]|uniref:Cache domain-containing protein n=1 Tax=Vibrio marinisediminis TaxID=2758441 RepID=A0A7W2FSX7_9VIBR|nr:cache domain-containing protein [Vibrio marinisediminis]MBA5763564.1 cache domain-containing protein [Vibrio marinisediminis]